MFNDQFVRNPHNYDVDAASDETAILCEDVSLTVQAEADEADINNIVRRFGLTGQLPTNVRVPLSGDFTQAMDYHSSLNALIAADQAFAQMPADIRARFKHDAANLVAFCEDPANYDEAVKLGIVNAVQAPVEASAVVPAPTA